MRVAVVGLGFMGLTHLKAYRKMPGVEIAAVVSKDPVVLTGDLSHIGGNLGGSGERFDFSRALRSDDPMEALRLPDVDAVDICLPTNHHAEIAVAALTAGKHVLVEKPMALSAADCERMMDAASRGGRILMTAQVLRFSPVYRALIDAVHGGRFGAVRHALFRRRCAAPAWSAWLTAKDASGGGVFDLLVHDFDMALACFGKPESVSATGYEDLPRGLDLITAQLHYADGFAATVTGGWHLPQAYPFSMEYTVGGDEGVMDFSSEGRDAKWYARNGTAEPVELSGPDGYEAEIEYFVECCRAGKQPDRCPPEASADAVRVAIAAADARKRNGEKVPCQW